MTSILHDRLRAAGPPPSFDHLHDPDLLQRLTSQGSTSNESLAIADSDDAEPVEQTDTDLPANIEPDTPLRLDVAAKLAFPGGGINAASLRREASAGRLVIERIAGKDFTTLTHIKNMRRDAAKCNDGVKGHASGSNRRNARERANLSDRQHGSSAIGARKVRTGCARSDREGAERTLADYIARKYQAPRESGRASH